MIHLVGLPHTELSDSYMSCAFTQETRKFIKLMSGSDFDITYYGRVSNNSDWQALTVDCVTKIQGETKFNNRHYTNPDWSRSHPLWRQYIDNVIDGVSKRIRQGDVIGSFVGGPMSALQDRFPANKFVELGVGYVDSFAKYRVWRSYSWMHACYSQMQSAGSVDGKFFDGVIPGFLEPADFDYEEKKENYLLFLGRVIPRKGIEVAISVARELNIDLIVAGIGQGSKSSNVQYLGEVDPLTRRQLLRKARALIAPTLYLEPFGYNVIEAQMSGTPVVTTDWGAFVETNDHGLTGYRCRTLQEFCDAVEKVGSLDPQAIRVQAVKKYSLDSARSSYLAYFQRLALLDGKGWYQRVWQENQL